MLSDGVGAGLSTRGGSPDRPATATLQIGGCTVPRLRIFVARGRPGAPLEQALAF
ncbi:MAG: hypothetical protein QOI76_4368 [Frankiales bacterium]|jgi:hypothetical protein|nr:hypothetical protein [Frankiales bacterium]